MKILVLGVNGLIGSTVSRVLSDDPQHKVWGTVRSNSHLSALSFLDERNILINIDVRDFSSLTSAFISVKPDIVINCVGVTKHKREGNEPIQAIELNGLFPHRLAQICDLVDARLIHISSDCVYSGSKGNYKETDVPDALDIYGKSKAMGEIHYGNSVTLRTSTIGHEINTNFGLLNWFLGQTGKCRGFSRAVFSGLPTISFAEVIRDYVIPNRKLSGLYHVAASPINKYELLNLIARVYNKKIEIQPDEDFVIDRSLDATKFNLETGYEPPGWEFLIKKMHVNK